MIQGTGNFPDARVLEKLIFGETAAQLRSALKYMSNFHSKPCQYFPVLFAKNDTFRIFKAKLYLMIQEARNFPDVPVLAKSIFKGTAVQLFSI